MITPKLITVRKNEIEQFPNLVILQGQSVKESTVPADLKEFWNLVPNQIHNGIGEFAVGQMTNEICKLISSGSVVNPINGGLGVPQFAMIPIDNTKPINATEQFLSVDNHNNPVYLGILLNSNIQEKILKAIRIIPRIPLDGINLANVQTSTLCNKVPVPSLYQIYGTHDDINETTHKNPAKLNWESITHPTRMSAEEWSFASDTSFIFNEKNYDKLKYRGFKLVVYEWNYEHATALDQTVGFYRVEFNFVENDEVTITLPDLQDPNEDYHYWVTIDFNDPIEEKKEMADSNEIMNAVEIVKEDEIESDMEEEIIMQSQQRELQKLIKLELKEIDRSLRIDFEEKLETFKTEVNDVFTKKEKQTENTIELVKTTLGHISETIARMQSEINSMTEDEDKKEQPVMALSSYVTMNELDDFNNRLNDRISELADVFEQRLNKQVKPGDSERAIIINHSTKLTQLEENITVIQELLDDLTAPGVNPSVVQSELGQEALIEEHKELIEESKIQMATTLEGLIARSIAAANTHLVDVINEAKAELNQSQSTVKTIVEVLPTPTPEVSVSSVFTDEKLIELSKQVNELDQLVQGMVDDAGILNIENTSVFELAKQPSIIKNWYLFGDNQSIDRSIILPKEIEDCRMFVIHNYTSGSGTINIDTSEDQVLSLMYNHKQLPDCTTIGLTARAEKLSIIYSDGKWHGELFDGIIN